MFQIIPLLRRIRRIVYTPHLISYTYTIIYISSTSQSNYIYIHTYIHTHIGGKYVYDYFIVSHCKPDFG